MSSEPGRFTEFVQRQAGETLRLVVRFTDDSSTVEYVREDVAQRYSKDEFDDIVEDARTYAGHSHSDVVKEAAGDLYCQVICFEHVVALVFPRDRGNTLVTMDPAAAQNLHEFASACEEFLQE